MSLARWLIALALCALAIGACTRVVVLTGAPDAANIDDGRLPDAGGISDGGDGGPLPDAFVLD